MFNIERASGGAFREHSRSCWLECGGYIPKTLRLRFTIDELRFTAVKHSFLKQLDEFTWEIAPDYKPGMQVPARIFASRRLVESMDEGVFEQITNVATLPGIVGYAIALPDAHRGYGCPIGAVAAFDPKGGGVISPGAIGFDINCGIRLMRTNLKVGDLEPRKKQLVNRLYERVPAGLGKGGFVKLNREEFKDVLRGGAEWCVKKGFGWEEDLERTEDGGKLDWADPAQVSEKAIDRGIDQVGTLGSGNHFLEIQRVSEIFDSEIARKFGIEEIGQVTVMIHTGSRGFGHQIGTDYLRRFGGVMRKYGISVADRELVCAPFESSEGRGYFGAMACGANLAFANRQLIMHRAREVLSEVFGKSAQDLGAHLVYDVAHNIAKIENGLIVHRKGATRAWGPGNPGLSGPYQKTGQPVLIGGSMQSRSYLLVGTKVAEEVAFGSTAHGSGRVMSRTQARRRVWGSDLLKKMHEEGIYIKAASMPGLAEEAGIAYKDISEVVRVLDEMGISKKVAEMEPVGNIKG